VSINHNFVNHIIIPLLVHVLLKRENERWESGRETLPAVQPGLDLFSSRMPNCIVRFRHYLDLKSTRLSFLLLPPSIFFSILESRSPRPQQVSCDDQNCFQPSNIRKYGILNIERRWKRTIVKRVFFASILCLRN